MRRTILLVVLAVGLCHAAANSLKQDTLKDYITNGTPFDFILIDVRAAREIEAGIGNGNCKPYNLKWPLQFKVESAKIPKDQTIIVYCLSGGRSHAAAAYLNSRGYSRVYDAGAFLTWNGPTVPPSDFKSASLLPGPSMLANAGK